MDGQFLNSFKMPSELKNFILKLSRENQRLWQTDCWPSCSVRDADTALQLSTVPVAN